MNVNESDSDAWSAMTRLVGLPATLQFLPGFGALKREGALDPNTKEHAILSSSPRGRTPLGATPSNYIEIDLEPKWLRVTSVYPSFNIQDFLLFLSQSSHGSFSLAPFVSFRLL